MRRGPDGGDDAILGSRALEVLDHASAVEEMLERRITANVVFLRQSALLGRVHGGQLGL